jgi:hypothetical protein
VHSEALVKRDGSGHILDADGDVTKTINRCHLQPATVCILKC